MKPQDVVKYFGSQQKAADALKCKQQTISGWNTTGVIPLGRQYQIEIITNGELKANA